MPSHDIFQLVVFISLSLNQALLELETIKASVLESNAQVLIQANGVSVTGVVEVSTL